MASSSRDRIVIALIVLTAVAWLTSGPGGAASAGPTGRADARTAALSPPANQPPSENLYVPITPCRLADSRYGEEPIYDTPFDPGEVRVFYVGGSTGFENQGGKVDGCGIPAGATAIAANFTVVSPTGAGRLNAWPNGVPEPTATTYYYAKQTGSGSAIVTINALSTYGLKVRNYSAKTHLVIDVTGYYVKPLAAVVEPDGDLYAGSSRGLGSTRIGVGQYRITFNTYVRNCVVTAGGYAANVNVGVNQYTYAATNQVEIRVYDADSGEAIDQYANVVVTC